MILGYIRCSTADQVKEDRSSLQTQTDVIEGFARTRGVDKYGVQIYTDAGVSGGVKLAKREAGAQLLFDMKPGDTVIASKLDRMFRSASDALNMIDVFKERGVHLVLFDMGAESVLESGVSKFLFIILAAVADMERIRIKERTAEGRKAKKARGGPIGEVPFGFKKLGEGRSATLVANEDERRAAQVMRELFQTGRGYSDISRDLAAQNMLSRSGKPFDRSVIRRELMRGMQ
jgi:DNA invertase Pin-like site-specific DNA recombinase